MIINLFKSFDPDIIKIPINLITIITLIYRLLIKKKSLNNKYTNFILNLYSEKLKNININNKNNILILFSLTILIILTNIINIIPNVISLTSIINYNVLLTLVL